MQFIFPLFRQLYNRAKQPRPGVNRQCGTDRTDEARHHVEPLHQAVAEFHGIVICRAMHHRQTHLVTLIAADDLVHHRRQRVGEAARLAQRVVDAFVVHIDDRLDLQQRADCALNAPDTPALAQEFERSDDERTQLMFAAFLQQRECLYARVPG